MSDVRQKRFICPKCGKKSLMQAHAAVDAVREKELHDSLLSGVLFRHTCPECGEVCEVSYSMLYKDRARNIMIYLFADDGEDGMPAVPESGRYKCRVVYSPEELIEKICIFEDGFSDEAMEIYKAVHAVSVRRNLQGEKLRACTYIRHNGKPALRADTAGGMGYVALVDKDAYAELSRMVPKDSVPEGFAHIDMNWGAKMIFE